MTKLHGVPLKAWTQEYNRLNKNGIDETNVVRWLMQGLLRGHKKARCLKCGSPIYVFRETGVDFGTTFANTPCPNEYCRSIGLDTRTRGVWMVETPAKSARAEVKRMRPLLRNPRGRPVKLKTV